MRRTRRRAASPGILLSIIMLHLPSYSRIGKYSQIAPEILRQTNGRPVEFFVIGDNKSISVGEKRNVGLDISSGKYVCFVDDDDEISEDYVSRILEAAQGKPDCIVFDMNYWKDDKFAGRVTFDIQNKRNTRNGTIGFNWMVNHLCPVRRDIALHALFPDSNLREDFEYAERIRPRLSTQVRIDKVLYTYRFNSQTTETRRQR